MSEFSNIEALALTKAGIKADRPDPGKHEVDFIARITGSVNVAADTERTPTVSIPMKEVLAIFIQRSGVTREASVKLLKEAMTEALKDGGTKGTGAIDAAADIEMASKDIVAEVTSALPKTPVKGRVTSSLTISHIEPAQLG